MSADEAIAEAVRVSGVRKKWILSRSLSPRHVSARRMVALLLCADGWSDREIGLELGRERSSIHTLICGRTR